MHPNDQSTIHWMEQALARGLVETNTLLVGDLNACLVQPRNRHKEEFTTTIDNHGL